MNATTCYVPTSITCGTKLSFLRSAYTQQQLIHADIGLTGFWGRPLRARNPSAYRLREWKAYPGTPWGFISGEDMPDLVLIDGRFRVAATLTCCVNLQTHPAAKILVDDYLDRPEYHVIASHAALVQTVGRMAVFSTVRS